MPRANVDCADSTVAPGLALSCPVVSCRLALPSCPAGRGRGDCRMKNLSLTVQKRKTSRISSVYAGFETFFIVNRYAYVAPSFWKNRMKGARARLSLIPGAEFSTRAYLSYKRLSYFFVCLHMFLIFAIGINSFEVSNPKAWCRESVSSLRL